MKHIRYWFARRKLLMAQAKDLARQLQEAWDTSERRLGFLQEAYDKIESITTQLHRVARERDRERELRLEAEDMLLDSYLRIHERDNEEE